eukprot:5274078-Amphidinium_carterae.1
MVVTDTLLLHAFVDHQQLWMKFSIKSVALVLVWPYVMRNCIVWMCLPAAVQPFVQQSLLKTLGLSHLKLPYYTSNDRNIMEAESMERHGVSGAEVESTFRVRSSLVYPNCQDVRWRLRAHGMNPRPDAGV